jgi:VanZ family protein
VAVSDELLQGFVAGRVADVADVIMDVLGGLTGGMVALAGILWIFLIQNKRAKRLPKSEEELGIDVVVVKRG